MITSMTLKEAQEKVEDMALAAGHVLGDWYHGHTVKCTVCQLSATMYDPTGAPGGRLILGEDDWETTEQEVCGGGGVVQEDPSAKQRAELRSKAILNGHSVMGWGDCGGFYHLECKPCGKGAMVWKDGTMAASALDEPCPGITEEEQKQKAREERRAKKQRPDTSVNLPHNYDELSDEVREIVDYMVQEMEDSPHGDYSWEIHDDEAESEAKATCAVCQDYGTGRLDDGEPYWNASFEEDCEREFRVRLTRDVSEEQYVTVYAADSDQAMDRALEDYDDGCWEEYDTSGVDAVDVEET